MEVEAASIVLARRDPAFFTTYISRDPATGLYYQQEELHTKWHQLITDYLWNLIEGPREHGKTEQIPIGRVIWELGHNHNLRVKNISNTDKEAMKRVMAVRDHIDHNPRVHKVFPLLRKGKVWTDHRIIVERDIYGTKDASLEGFGVLSGGTGGRADLMICDDMVDFENAIKSPALIDKVADAYFDKWVNLLTPKSRVVYIFTRWHERDLSHRLIRQAKRQNIQASSPQKYKYTVDLINDKLDTICPSMWTPEELLARKEHIGTRSFARGYQGRAMTDEEAIFRIIERCVDTNLRRSEVSDEWPNYMGVDLGHREKKDRARSVLFTITMNPESKKKFWRDIQIGNWSSPETARRAITEFKKYRHRKVFVENNAYQQAFIDWLKEMPETEGLEYKVRPFTTGKNKADEELGLPAVSVEMENMGIIIPHGDSDYTPSCTCVFCQAINEFLSYPIGEFKDCVMAHWFACEACRPPKVGIA